MSCAGKQLCLRPISFGSFNTARIAAQKKYEDRFLALCQLCRSTTLNAPRRFARRLAVQTLFILAERAESPAAQRPPRVGAHPDGGLIVPNRIAGDSGGLWQ